MVSFQSILEKYRQVALSERDKGTKFEELIARWFKTDPTYQTQIKEVWMWNQFPYKNDISGKDTGIDLVALTYEDEYWAIQCKCYQENNRIEKSSIDSFLSTSSKLFKSDKTIETKFSRRIIVSTTHKWSTEAENSIHNQDPIVTLINQIDLENSAVNWEVIETGQSGKIARSPKKILMAHQIEAVEKTNEYFKNRDRGKLIMACGTGKTFTSLKIAERETNNSGLILFLVPSIALMGQTLREWCAESELDIYPICVCSDEKVKSEDSSGFYTENLALPASTDEKKIIQQLQNKIKSSFIKKGMIVIFSTYQSIDVVSKAINEYNGINKYNVNNYQLLDSHQKEKKTFFDLIICDEAHRTTGVEVPDKYKSAFIRIHDNDYIPAKKRLYMTATPRLYNDDTKKKAKENDLILCSMDDEKIYGEEIYYISFGQAVEEGLLSDYKVLILTVNEKLVSVPFQNAIADKEIDIDDASKLIGCINALSKKNFGRCQ